MHFDMNGAKHRQGSRATFPLLVCAILTVLLGLPLQAGADKKSKTELKQGEKAALAELPLRWRVWLDEEVYPLITKDQRRAFLALETEAQRTAFVERLWTLWSRESGIGVAFRRMYEDRLQMARMEFGNTIEDRARVLLIHGPPAVRHDPRCESIFQKMEFWIWPYLEGLGEDVVALFYQRHGMGHWRLWTKYEGTEALRNDWTAASERGGGWGAVQSPWDSPVYRCPNGDVTMRLLAAVTAWSSDPSYLGAMTRFRSAERDQGLESTSHRFMEFSALLEDDAEPLDFSISSETRAGRGGLAELSIALDVDAEGLGTNSVGDVDVLQLDVVGELTSEGEVMVDRFRYLFSVPQAEDRVGLTMERLVRPGNYHLRVKVEDVHSKHAAIDEDDVVVEAVEPSNEELEAIGGHLEGGVDAASVDEEEAEVQPMLRLLGPQGDAVSGLCRFEAIAREEVRRVTFLLDDEAILTKNRPPFDIDLDLGPLPKLTTVTVVGYDASGEEIARDGYTLNVGRERFYVSLRPVSPSEGSRGQVRVAAEVNTPTDAELDRLELYWNDELLDTIYEPPFETLVTLNTREQFGYLRALAVLDDGAQAEDLQFVNTPEFGTVVKVTAVELPITVLDKAGNPVEDLTMDDFTVYENKVEQSISHFSLHRDLPVRMGMVIDTSGSMEETLPTVQRVVMGFLSDLLRPRDRAFIETFSDRPDLLAGFTADFATIENAMLALYPDRATAFYDAVIMGLFQFSGVSGRRAMVVLTDGEDTASKNSFEDALGYAQRMGVTIYMVGVGIPSTKITTRWQISKLADVTGGQSFFVSEKSELDRIYDEINRELRTQYLIAYTSSSEDPPDVLRKIKVEVDRKGVKVRTLTGYYPAGG
ncbi:MAG: VWA domain-containing protein [Acidobacteria bacterium]|nr:VWA domain-containing protein [Acidobacteriota bacterium]